MVLPFGCLNSSPEAGEVDAKQTEGNDCLLLPFRVPAFFPRLSWGYPAGILVAGRV